MIQRRQTIYLLLAAVCAIVALAVGVGLPYVWIFLALMAVGSIANIFLYKRRPLQANICVSLMGLALMFYIAIAVYQHQLNGTLVFTWPMALPAVSIIFWFLARKGIIKDEKLVRSLDRIR